MVSSFHEQSQKAHQSLYHKLNTWIVSFFHEQSQKVHQNLYHKLNTWMVPSLHELYKNMLIIKFFLRLLVKFSDGN